MLYSLLSFSIKNTETLVSNYFNFIKTILKNKFYKLLPYSILYNNILIKFYISNLKLTTNKYEIKNLNYLNSKLNPFYQVSIPIDLYFNAKLIKFNYNLFKFPKIDSENNLILNGLKKIFISKIKRDSGLYFNIIKKNNFTIYKAFLLFNNLNLINIQLINNTFKIYNFKDKKEIDFIIFLHYLGISNSEIIKLSKYGNSNFLKNILINSFNNYKFIYKNKIFYLKYLKQLSSYFGIINNKNNIYLNSYTIKINNLINKIEKEKFNNIFGFDIRNNLIYLSKDLINILDYLIDLKFNKINITDLDNFSNKKLENVINIFLNQLNIILEKRLKFLLNNLKKLNINNKNNFINFINNKNYIYNFKDQFNIHPLIQYLDQINSLSEIMHKFKLIKSNKINNKEFALRDIKLSELGKLCLINTSEGLNSGLIVYLPQNIIIDNFQIRNPIKINKNYTKLFKIKTINSIEQEKYNISLDYKIIRKNKQLFSLNSVNFYKNYLNKNILNQESYFHESEIFSLAQNLIPFLIHNEPTRSLMGAKMQTQSVPLIYKQKPLITTNTQQILSLKNNNIYSLQEGIITYVSSYKIIIRDLLNREITYYLPNYNFSNQNTLINYIPLVWPGERVSSGQLIANSQDFIDNEFSIGNNCFILYGSYLGYDFEDALIINKNLINNNIFTSLHLDYYEISCLYDINNYLEITSNKIPKYTKYAKRNLDNFGIIKEGSKILKDDVLIGKIKLYNLTKKQESLGKFLFVLFGYQLRNIKDTSILVSSGNSGRIAKIELISNFNNFKELNNYLKIKIFVIKQRLLEIGDKLWGRYGNKGVISHIANSVDLPYTEDSITPDIITTSIGVPSRMNLGQLYESLFGLNCYYLNKRLLLNTNLNNKLGSNYLKTLLYNYLKEINLYKGISNFNSYNFGKTQLFNGKTGKMLKGTNLFGTVFYTKLIHMVKDKIHYRTIGPYSTITQQPLKSRSKKGGQRFGEMEVWALEAFGAAYNLKELFTFKSDNIKARFNLQEYLLYNLPLKNSILSESFYLVLNHLKSLALNIEALIISEKNKDLKNLIK
uniref:DNA-directed RNA polymerase subunit beta n=1 Tax=Nephromyces sp. ex Molgula occidentalis TaxID=2544991 RepID=A0A5C1H7E1_9APIC|nr:plastid-encoded DNA-directed RNA polymerase beta [Nephromyces sp. ex Molgula occidentalis]